MGSLSAQNFKVDLSRTNSNLNNSAVADTVKILAIMMNFQEDRDGTTSGNGKFESIYSLDYGTSIIDPLPHNKEYFEDHLLFAQNYFRKVSNQNLYIEYFILPDTFSVSQTMRNYSPDPGSNDFTHLGEFAIEAWTLADEMYPGFDFASYDLFTIFHAGVGRDISLPGSIGNERDLPSVYLSEQALKDLFGQDFEGIPVSGGTFNITNTLILPETESRELSALNGTNLIEISINGLIAASIGSYIGLPDLFDTETGLSAIGRFGLMDGQSIFAYLGTFPPEPSPWSKIRMGWIEPVTLDIGNTNVSIVTKLAAELSDTVVLKIPINSSEYYLIENRNRDANEDGSKITYKVNGITLSRTFSKDTTGFLSYDIDSLSGVIIDVDEFDWAVPGSGIVIWHIDENVINEKIAENKINTDKKHRGVDVEEADGIQDIGETFNTVFGDEVIGEGTEEDLWYSSNPADLYSNRFAKDTRPDTRTNSGANSLITIKGFSDINNRMRFRIEFGDSVIKPLSSNKFNFSGNVNSFSSDQYQGNITYQVLVDSDFVLTSSDSLLESNSDFSSNKIATAVIGNNQHFYGANGNNLNFKISDGNTVHMGSVPVDGNITSPVVVNKDENSNYQIILGTNNGKILFYSPGNLTPADPTLIESVLVDTTLMIKKVAADGNYYSLIADPKYLTLPPSPINLFFDSNGFNYSFTSETPVDLCLTKDQGGNFVSIVLTSASKIYIFSNGEMISSFKINGSDQISSIALADIKKDGMNYILVVNGENLEAYNFSGAMADNFPFKDPEGIGFTGTPVAADFEGDLKSELIGITADGRVYAIDGGTGKVIPGLPISTGAAVGVTPVLYNANGVTNLAVLNNDNNLSVWSISSVDGNLFWTEENGNSQNTSFVDAADNSNRINEFFPTSRAYNYPNPVYEGETNIRYFVSEDSRINIKIFDLAGDFVAEMNDDAQGGMDNETVWNVDDIQSGVYFARIEATSSSGKKENAIIKIAVVK